jgi:putative ABC transport system permease protein
LCKQGANLGPMIQNYFLVALRNITRYASYSVINVLGLALGMACALIIFALVSHHLSYDTFHPSADRIYRIVTEQHRDQVSYTNSCPVPLAKALRDDYTYTEKATRAITFGDEIVYVTEKGNVKKFVEPDISLVEPDFFEIFSKPMLNGDAVKLIQLPNAAIITEKVAKKYFGTVDAVDRTFRIGTRGEFRVAGIMKDIPDNTDLRAEVFIPYENLKAFADWMAKPDAWGGISSPVKAYVRLKPDANIGEIEEAMFGYVKKFRPNSKNVHHYKLQPLSDMHFDPRYNGVMSLRTIVALSIIGFFLVITACVNFINLATARATSRSREVGVRKVLGGVRSQIFSQFMAETFVITLVSGVVAVSVASALVPFFNEQFESRLTFNFFSDWRLTMFIPALMIVVTFLAGFYPGLVLSGYQAAQALKGKLTQMKSGGLNLRRALIVTQFSISQVLIIVLIVIIYQVHYSRNSDLGFDGDAIVMVPVGSNDEKTRTLKLELERVAGVEGVSLCFMAPSSQSSWSTSARFGNRDEDENYSVVSKIGDENYLSLFDIDLVAGRNLNPSDSVREFLINEEFVDKLGLTPQEVLGQTIRISNQWKAPIVGVVSNFHDASFHQDIKPIFIGAQLDMYSNYAIKVNMAHASETLKEIEKKWSATYPELVYSSEFLDDQIASFYEAEENMTKMVGVFSFVAILVGCMGLFGLVSFMAIQRTKEIGIRKVLGGSISHILWLFGKEFALLIAVSFVLAGPAGWWLMNKWLEDYQYKVTLGAWIFIIAISSTAIIAFLTVGYRSLRAATTNPVNSLRME